MHGQQKSKYLPVYPPTHPHIPSDYLPTYLPTYLSTYLPNTYPPYLPVSSFRSHLLTIITTAQSQLHVFVFGEPCYSSCTTLDAPLYCFPCN